MKHPTASRLFVVAGALFVIAGLRDLFFPRFLSLGGGTPALSFAIGSLFIIIGLAQRRRIGSSRSSV